MRDLDFIAGDFFDLEIPKQQLYLLKYFKTDLQQAFLRYYMVFGNVRNFVDHTGYHCSERMLFILQRKYKNLVKAHAKAKSELTEESLETLQIIESGRYKA